MKPFNLFLISSVFMAAVICTAFPIGTAQANNTYFVRPDGGTATQCNGLSDAPYPGSGEQQACAWSHPFWALTGTDPPVWRIQGGDTLIIAPGSYRMGLGAPNTERCEPEGAFTCNLPPLPSGPDGQHPTSILGATWNQGCSNPPELWGAERTWQIFNLDGTSHARIQCLELTDHSGCVEYHANPQISCQRDTPPFGDWASAGIHAADAHDITLKQLNIHGFADRGIYAGRISDWTVEDVRIAGNGMAGWDGDIEGDDANSGTLRFKNLTIEWNGCGESYPEKQINNCWAQTAGGYGDGLGTGATGGHWIFEDSVFRYNTSDGLDLLYARLDSTIDIHRTQSYGNAGDQIKVNGPTTIENSLMVSNCGYFNGKAFTWDVDNCRAGGSALVLALRQATAVSVTFSTLAGQGDCLGIVECDNGSCDGTESVRFENNVFMGYDDFLTPGDTTCWLWFDRENFYNTAIDYNIVYDVKLGEIALASHDSDQNPMIANATLETFDGRLTAASPAIDSGYMGSAQLPSMDILGTPRPQGTNLDRGAYEYIVPEAPVRVGSLPGALSFDVDKQRVLELVTNTTNSHNEVPVYQWLVFTLTTSGRSWPYYLLTAQGAVALAEADLTSAIFPFQPGPTTVFLVASLQQLGLSAGDSLTYAYAYQNSTGAIFIENIVTLKVT